MFMSTIAFGKIIGQKFPCEYIISLESSHNIFICLDNSSTLKENEQCWCQLLAYILESEPISETLNWHDAHSNTYMCSKDCSLCVEFRLQVQCKHSLKHAKWHKYFWFMLQLTTNCSQTVNEKCFS